mgnify:FL=1
MKYLPQIYRIILLSIILGFFRFYFISDDSFTLIKKERILETVDALDLPDILTEPKQIDTQSAHALHIAKGAVFIDARDINDFNEGHISGAINIPYDYYEDYDYIIENLDKTSIYVIYCSGGECSLSIDLADYLFYELDFENILIYDDGFPDWLQNGYDVK